jgi:hypothetical protein
MVQQAGKDLDDAWDSVPAAPAVEELDPVERLKRIFRGAIAANKALWRSVDLDNAVVTLEGLARARPQPTSPIQLEPVRKRLVPMHAPRGPLRESLVVFVHEARQAGFAIVLPVDFDDLGEEQRQQLLRGFYARLARDGDASDVRTKALAGELIIFPSAERSERIKWLLAGLVVVFGVAALADDTSRDAGPRPVVVALTADAVACSQTLSHGSVLRCELTAEAARALVAEPPATQRRRFVALRRVAAAQSLDDVIVIGADGLPMSPP